MPLLVEALRGVPKAALRTVLGNELGKRAWDAAAGGSSRGTVKTAVSDDEIVAALLVHLSRRAAESLERERRRALVVSLSLECADGGVIHGRLRLAGPTSDGMELLSGVQALYEGMKAEHSASGADFAGRIRRLELDVTVTLPEPAQSTATAWRWRTQEAAGLA
jgi:hypothetical protein